MPTLPPIDQAFDGNLVCIQFDVFLLFLFFWKGGGSLKRFASSLEMEDRLLLMDDFLPANSPVSGDAQVYPLSIKQTYHLKTEMERNGLINLKHISVPKKKKKNTTTTRNRDVIHYGRPYLQQPSRKAVLLWCRQGSPSARPYHEGVEYRAAMLLPSFSARDSAVWSALSPAVL